VGEFSLWHWVVVAGLALLLFGPKKLPELGKGLAEGIKGFKDGLKDTPPPPVAAAPTEKKSPDA
jgi:sec-independent protein translocase protein TatA